MIRNIPNIITCCNLICGCIATLSGFEHHFTNAFIFILLGALFDFLDGFTARLMKVSGKMGIELDSLADVITFGMAPAAMVFTLFTRVCYPEMIYSPFWFAVLPCTAFLIPAFSALRLAKFNIDERQHTTFIGLPTPANAIFWASLISSSEAFLCSQRFNAPFLLAFVVLFCWLLVCEVPMFSLKFKSLKWEDNKLRFSYLILSAAILLCAALSGADEGQTWQSMSRALAFCLGLYPLVNILKSAWRL